MRCARSPNRSSVTGVSSMTTATMPFPTAASQFHDLSVNRVFSHVLDALVDQFDAALSLAQTSAFGQVSQRHRLIEQGGAVSRRDRPGGARTGNGRAQAEQAGSALAHLSASAELVDEPALQAYGQLSAWPSWSGSTWTFTSNSMIGQLGAHGTEGDWSRWCATRSCATRSSSRPPRTRLPALRCRFASDADTRSSCSTKGSWSFPVHREVFDLKQPGEDLYVCLRVRGHRERGKAFPAESEQRRQAPVDCI